VPVTVPDVAELLGLAASDEVDELELPDELEPLEELELPVVGAAVLPLYGVLADVLPPAAAAVEDVEVW
jgi:hypothetical protein